MAIIRNLAYEQRDESSRIQPTSGGLYLAGNLAGVVHNIRRVAPWRESRQGLVPAGRVSRNQAMKKLLVIVTPREAISLGVNPCRTLDELMVGLLTLAVWPRRGNLVPRCAQALGTPGAEAGVLPASVSPAGLAYSRTMRGKNWARMGIAKLCRCSAMAWRTWFNAKLKAPIRLTLKAWTASGASASAKSSSASSS